MPVVRRDNHCKGHRKRAREKLLDLGSEKLRDYEVEKDETETYLKEELDRLIVEKYNGDFSTFMQKEVLNEDYGDLRTEVERLFRS